LLFHPHLTSPIKGEEFVCNGKMPNLLNDTK